MLWMASAEPWLSGMATASIHRNTTLVHFDCPEGPLNAWELRKRNTNSPNYRAWRLRYTSNQRERHVTTANGFLAAGAKTVVATSLPIDARASGLFVARLLLRINQLLPLHFAASERPVQVVFACVWNAETAIHDRHCGCYSEEASASRRTKCSSDALSLDAGGLIDTGQEGWLGASLGFFPKCHLWKNLKLENLLKPMFTGLMLLDTYNWEALSISCVYRD